MKFLKDSKYAIVRSVIFRAMPQTCITLLETVFCVFFFLTLEPVKNCKLPQLCEIQCVKMCVFMNFYGFMRNRSEMKMVFILLQSSPVWWSQEILWPLVVSACPHCKRTELLSNIQKCIHFLARGHWSCKIFQVYPSSSIRFGQSMRVVPDINPFAEAGPSLLD